MVKRSISLKNFGGMKPSGNQIRRVYVALIRDKVLYFAYSRKYDGIRRMVGLEKVPGVSGTAIQIAGRFSGQKRHYIALKLAAFCLYRLCYKRIGLGRLRMPRERGPGLTPGLHSPQAAGNGIMVTFSQPPRVLLSPRSCGFVRPSSCTRRSRSGAA